MNLTYSVPAGGPYGAAFAREENVVLVVDDDPGIRALLADSLQSEGYSVRCASGCEEALVALTECGTRTAAALVDLRMPGRNGIELVREIRLRDHGLPIIVFSGSSTPTEAADAIKSGADDFLAKPFNLANLRAVIRKTVKSKPARAAAGSVMSGIESTLHQVAVSDAPVLLRGESGVGKEVFGRKIHSYSPRSTKRFVKINCAALPTELLENELFGHDRGAFTGADECKPGIFEQADGGTILLDEIGDMDVRLQAKLLQVLQDLEFRRVGGKDLLRVNVRVLSATHRDLEQRIAEGEFREDLFYRLNVIAIRIPPLRERRDEILPLARLFWEKYGVHGLAPPDIPALLQKALLDYHWPGNIRELENVIRRFQVLQNADLIASELRSWRPPGVPRLHVDLASSTHLPNQGMDLAAVQANGKEAECQLILNALRAAHWNRRKAAVALKIDYRSLLYKIKKLSIEEKASAQMA